MTYRQGIIVENSTLDYCQKKTIEELFELGECIIKQITKPLGASSPERIQHLIEEMGDVLLNVELLALKMGVYEQVLVRKDKKRDQCLLRIEVDNQKLRQ